MSFSILPSERKFNALTRDFESTEVEKFERFLMEIIVRRVFIEMFGDPLMSSCLGSVTVECCEPVLNVYFNPYLTSKSEGAYRELFSASISNIRTK